MTNSSTVFTYWAEYIQNLYCIYFLKMSQNQLSHYWTKSFLVPRLWNKCFMVSLLKKSWWLTCPKFACHTTKYILALDRCYWFSIEANKYINFEMTIFLYTENQEQWMKSMKENKYRLFIGMRGCVQGSESRSNHRKCFKKAKGMDKKSGIHVLKKWMVLTLVMIFYGFV